jgi:hypothetical protein
METKTTLAALLLAAVMVTPSYGESPRKESVWGEQDVFTLGAQEYISNAERYEKFLFVALDNQARYFQGMVKGIVRAKDLRFPKGTTWGQIRKAVAYYVDLHKDEVDKPVTVILKAIKREWPESNKHVVIPE